MSANSHEYLELYHAGFLGAGIINPLNLRLAGKELQFILADSEYEGRVRRLAVRRSLRCGTSPTYGPTCRSSCRAHRRRRRAHDVRYEDLIERRATRTSRRSPTRSDPVVLMYTGGTTGLPKGVLLDQRAEMLNLYHIGMTVGLQTTTACYLHQTPMFHAASMAGVLGIPATRRHLGLRAALRSRPGHGSRSSTTRSTGR